MKSWSDKTSPTGPFSGMKYRRIDLGTGNHWRGRQHLEIVQHASNPPHRWPAVEGCVPRVALKWSCFSGQVFGLAKMHLVSVLAAFRVSASVKYAMSGVRLSRAV